MPILTEASVKESSTVKYPYAAADTTVLDARPELRVLHVFSNLGVGGAETWLIALLRYLQDAKTALPFRIQFDVCITGGSKGTLDEEAISLGANIFYLTYTRKRVISFIRDFRTVLARGRYHAIHDHQDYTAGLHFLFGIGRLPGVRIAHVHNPAMNLGFFFSSTSRRLTLKTGKRLLAYLSTHVMGTSREVVAKYGFSPDSFSRVRIGAAHCGFDVSRFREDYLHMHEELCREFGWGKASKIILFVGRLNSNLNQKNPGFALEVARACMATDASVRLLMAGGGYEVKRKLGAQVHDWGLSDKIRLIGERPDVPRLMQGSDLLLFPSIEEGLGMVAVEAQATGLRVLASDTTPRECAVIPEMVWFKSLDDGVSSWAVEALRLLGLGRPNPGDCNLAVRRSAFSIENSAKRLIELYEGGSTVNSKSRAADASGTV